MNYSNSRAQMGMRQGQEGVWGVFPTRTFPSVISGDSRIFYVNPNHTLAVDAGNLGRDPEVPLATIQAAHTLARSNMGDVILVAGNDGWQYGPLAATRQNPIAESVTITKSGLRLVGVSPSALGVYWQPAATTDFCLTVYGLDFYVEGFAFTNTLAGFANANGIYTEWNNAATLLGENITINRCYFDEAIDIGIQIEFSWYVEIMNCLFDHTDDAGVWVDTGGSGAAFASIHDNRFIDCAFALRLHDTTDSEVFRNAIFNTDAQNANAGCALQGIDTTGGGQNLVYDNFFSCDLAGAGGWAVFNNSAATDAWINNHLMDGDTITNP